jgi:glycerate dehydrogenase
MIVVLDGYALNPGDLSWNGLRKLGEVQIYERTPEEWIVERAGAADIILTNKTRLTAATLDKLTGLRYIGALATGYDVIDVQAARGRGITVTNVPTYGTESVAQFTIALLLELCQHVGVHNQAVQGGAWLQSPDWTFWRTPLVELYGKTMGIVGFGRIGRQVGKVVQALGMRVIASDAVRENAPDWPGFGWLDVDGLMQEADVVSLHCPLTPQTQGMVNASRLSRMKPNAFLLNTSRGPLVVESDLASALNERWLAGAALDVLAVEPPHPANPLFQARNCIITPHIAWATKEARIRLLDAAVGNLAAFLEGRPQNVVS